MLVFVVLFLWRSVGGGRGGRKGRNNVCLFGNGMRKRGESGRKRKG